MFSLCGIGVCACVHLSTKRDVCVDGFYRVSSTLRLFNCFNYMYMMCWHLNRFVQIIVTVLILSVMKKPLCRQSTKKKIEQARSRNGYSNICTCCVASVLSCLLYGNILFIAVSFNYLSFQLMHDVLF